MNSAVRQLQRKGLGQTAEQKQVIQRGRGL